MAKLQAMDELIPSAGAPGTGIVSLDYGGAGYALRHPEFGGEALAVDGSADWSAVLETASASVVSSGGGLLGGPGVYGFDEDAVCDAPFTPQPGFLIRPANGKTVTFNGAVTAGGTGWIDLSLGGAVVFGPEAVDKANALWFGATYNIAGQCTNPSALVAAARSAVGADRTVVLPPMTYVAEDTIHIDGDFDGSGATVRWGGTGTALEVRNQTYSDLLAGHSIITPRVLQTEKPGFGEWVGGDVGLRVHNTMNSQITVGEIENFAVGLWLSADGQGCAYNSVTLTRLYSNQVNQLLEVSGAVNGYVNENNFWGGRFQHRSGEGADAPGTRQIKISFADSTINNNCWYGPSLEGPVAEYRIECWGQHNYWIRPRFENPDNGPLRVAFWSKSVEEAPGNHASGNVIFYGRGADRITVEESARSTGNVVYSYGGNHISAAGTSVLHIQNEVSDTDAAITVYDSSGSIHGKTVSGDYRVRITSSDTWLRGAGDAHARIRFRHALGQILLGDGDSLASGGIRHNDGAVQVFGGLPLMLHRGTYNQEPLKFGPYTLWRDTDGRLRWRSGTPTNATDGLPLQLAQSGATGSRPTTPPTGWSYFDTTLGQPIWYDGSGWVDATGTAA